jgi:hypothetical protein
MYVLLSIHYITAYSVYDADDALVAGRQDVVLCGMHCFLVCSIPGLDALVAATTL